MDLLFDISSSYFLFPLFISAFLTGLVGSMGAPGGLIILPFMMGCGISPAVALGTSRLAGIGAWLIAAKRFSNSGQIRKKELPVFVLLALIAGAIGSFIIIDANERYIYPIVGTILIAIGSLSLLKKNFGLEAKETGKKNKRLGYILYFFIMIYGGFIGAGATPMLLFVLVHFLGFRALEAFATELVAWVAMSVLSSAIFMYYGQINYIFVPVIFAGMGSGSFIGSHFAIKGGDKWIKSVVAFFALLVGVKLLVWG
jgi:uncharacterized membrane protein YfcA